MSAIPIIRQGEDLDFVFDLDGEDITDWICEAQVSQTPEDEFALIKRVIPPVGNEWPGQLNSTETAALAPSSESPYHLTGILKNASTDQQRQIPKRFHVSPAWA